MKKLLTGLLLLGSISSFAESYYGHCVTTSLDQNISSSCINVSYNYPVFQFRPGGTQKAYANGINAKRCRREWKKILNEINIDIPSEEIYSAMFNNRTDCEKNRIRMDLKTSH